VQQGTGSQLCHNSIQHHDRTVAGNVVYFDVGISLVITTIFIPPGAKIVEETYPVIMGSGSYFSDMTNTQPVMLAGSTAAESGVN
jgi:glucan 1,3-beta-glucosidase